MLYRPDYKALSSADLPRVLAELDRVCVSLQGAEDGLWANAEDLIGVADRICQEGPAAVRADLGEEDFGDVVRRLAAVASGLGTMRSLRMARETVAGMLD